MLATMIEVEAERYRPELQAHCYRMLGSLHEAEDAVQETLLRAWRAASGFDGRASLRTWLHRIATNVCLTAVARRRLPGRALPERAGLPATRPPQGEPPAEVLWLEPYPDAALAGIPDDAPGPHARYEARETTELAFVAAIQYLPPRQRAALLLRDVLGCSAAEAAQTLEVSVASVNSAVQRARQTLRRTLPRSESFRIPSPSSERQRTLLDRYVHAWEAYDLNGLVSILKEDAIFSMPPRPEWYRGRAAIRDLLAWGWNEAAFDALRLLPSRANGLPAFALYGRRSDAAGWEAHALQVVMLDDHAVGQVWQFLDTTVFRAFDLPLSLSSTL